MTTVAKHVKLSEEKALEIAVRSCSGLTEFATCIEIERAVWGSADVDIVPLPLFVVAAETGGQVLGAFAGDRMIGFTLALPGVRGRKPLLHSHMTAVLHPFRNKGAARKLKLFQCQEALGRGIDLIEWTFDPLEIKNAHFNFRLGVIVRRFIPNMYGVTTSPLHGRLPTDRLVAEWRLRSPRVRRAIADKRPAAKARSKEFTRIRVPADFARIRSTNPEDAARLQGEVRQEFEHWLASGYAATGIDRTDDAAEYLLEPWADK
ncbi:MAG: acetyltransferase [Acidobacteria bacterium]|nr:MAG: acetyltransferase [Acidobacteriota bacterium]